MTLTCPGYDDVVHFDYETRSRSELKVEGIMRYAKHASTKVLMVAYSFESEDILGGKKRIPRVHQWDHGSATPFPKRLADAIENPRICKVAFNAAFERLISKHVMRLKTDYTSWRCGMVLAYCLSFIGGLGDIGKQIGQKEDKAKKTVGEKLINLFCKPQRLTKKNPYEWLDALTNPEEYDEFLDYNVRDVEAECDQWHTFVKYPIGDREWRVYALDQKINDRGIPVDLTFCKNAIWMVERRKEELKKMMQDITGLSNPNSPAQLQPWLNERGYPFDNLRKENVKKALAAYDAYQKTGDEAPGWQMTEECVEAARLRRWSASTAATKYKVFLNREVDGRYPHGLQMAGAQRTRRFGGRGVQPHNMARTPKDLEMSAKEGAPDELPFPKLRYATELVRRGDYETLKLFSPEPMEVLAGCVRSAIRAADGRELRISDLTSIESIGVGYIAECERILNVFRSGKDIYKDFGTVLFNKAYEEITKQERGDSKPAVLGAGYGLGGGGLNEKQEKTGLWAYAESMGIALSQSMSKEAVDVFRNDYAPEVSSAWGEIDVAIRNVLKDGKPRTVRKLRFEYMRPFLCIWLPSGRCIFYYKPRIKSEKKKSERTGREYTRYQFCYMGKAKNSNQWVEVTSWGGKVIENVVQAFCRDALVDKLLDLDDEGFNLVLHVHDEAVAEEDLGDLTHTKELLNDIMKRPLPYAMDMPLGAAGVATPFYLKD
jgi:DNA polymerase